MMKPVQSLNALFYMRLGHTWVRTFKFALKKGTKLQAGPAPQPTAAPLLTKSPAGFTRTLCGSRWAPIYLTEE